MRAAVLGIDGGNSKADLALAAPNGTILGAARTESVSHQAVGLEEGSRKATQPGPVPDVAAVSPLPNRYTPSVTMNSFRRPSASDSRPNTSAPATWPTR